MRVECCQEPSCAACGGRGAYFDERCPRCERPRERSTAPICDRCADAVAAALRADKKPQPRGQSSAYTTTAGAGRTAAELELWSAGSTDDGGPSEQ